MSLRTISQDKYELIVEHGYKGRKFTYIVNLNPVIRSVRLSKDTFDKVISTFKIRDSRLNLESPLLPAEFNIVRDEVVLNLDKTLSRKGFKNKYIHMCT